MTVNERKYIATFFIHHFHNKLDAKQQPFFLTPKIKIIFPAEIHSTLIPITSIHTTVHRILFSLVLMQQSFHFSFTTLLHFLTPFGKIFYTKSHRCIPNIELHIHYSDYGKDTKLFTPTFSVLLHF